MSFIKNIWILIIVLSLQMDLIAQQLPQFSQYMYNTISINPAYAGSREFMVINILNRNQWVGINGGPITQTFSAHTSLPKTKFGIGLSIINDQLGYEKMTYAYADISYTINLNYFEDYKLAFGLKVGASKYDIDSDLRNDPLYSDDQFLNTINYKWYPNIGAGIYFRGEDFYLGISTPKLFSYIQNNEYVYIVRVSYFLNGGYLIDVNKHLKFKSTFLVKYTNGAPLSFDISSLFYFNKKLWLGASYRFSDSFGFIANFKINENLSLGYSFDYTTSILGDFTFGSHEVMINYEFEFPKPRCKCKDLYN